MRVTNREILDLLVTGEPGRFLFRILCDVYITVLSKTSENKDMYT
jgi:hypothetical protein